MEPLPGDPGASRIKLSAFVRSQPQSRLADDAAYKLSELAIMQNDMTDAQRWLDWLIRNHPRGNREVDARLRLAQLEYEQGNTSAARKLLLPLKFARLSEDQKKTAYRLLANLASSRVSALRWLEQLERVEAATADNQALALTEARIDGVLASASFEDLEGAAAKLGDSALGTRIQLAQAQRALSLGKPDAAREAIERARRRIRSPSDEERVRRAQEQLVLRGGAGGLAGGDLPTFEAVTQNRGFSTRGATGTLGVVLPLTGSFAAYGETSLRGILLAAGIFDDRDHEANAASRFSIDRGIESLPPGMNIIVRDSGGEPDRAAQAVRELAADPSLVAIVGPLLSRSAEAAAEAAEEEGVPLLAMTRRDEIARERSEVLRLRMSPRDEVGFSGEVRHRRTGCPTLCHSVPA